MSDNLFEACRQNELRNKGGGWRKTGNGKAWGGGGEGVIRGF